jgi:hypothetical protein
MEIQSMNEKTPEIVYSTTLEKCTCKHWQYVISVKGGFCKHQKQLLSVSEVKEL